MTLTVLFKKSTTTRRKFANKYCISNKVKEVSFKMLHIIYPLKHVLERFKLNIDYKCDFCGMEETILHVFFDCISSRIFWIDIQNFVTKRIGPIVLFNGLI